MGKNKLKPNFIDFPKIAKDNIIIAEDQTSQVDVPSEYLDDDKQNNSVIFDSPQRCSTPEQNDLLNSKSIKVGTVDYRKLEIPEKNGYAYVCGYIMKKCLEKHVCQVCVDYANHQKTLDHSFLLAFFKSYSTNDSSNFDKLLMPHDDFYNYIKKLDDFFIDNFPSIATNNNIGSTMKDLICNLPTSGGAKSGPSPACPENPSNGLP
ncbi:hypothetical protein ACI65C_010929 [Semiaphis heraclei]